MRPLMPPVQTPDNLFHDGNPITGELGTLVEAQHLNNVQATARDIQSELISILAAAAKVPDSSSVHQVLDALRAIFAPINSPQFTGIPAAPNPDVGLNNNQVATTFFVQSLITALIGGAPAGLNTLNKIALSLGNDPIFAANVNAALVLKSPLNSPQFTGVPAAPTPDVGLNNNQIATTAFVKAALAALIDSAPGSLDTLKELANALANDPNFATTITNALALKAPLNSPTFTGDPRAPTPAAGDNDTSIATTAFITAALTAFLPKRVFTANDFIRIPDVPGGLIIQWGGMSVADSNGLCVANYPTPFPAGPLASTATYYNASRNNITTTLASTTATQIQAFASYAHTNVPAVGAPLRFLTLGF